VTAAKQTPDELDVLFIGSLHRKIEWKASPDQRMEAVGALGFLIVPGTSQAQYDGQLGSP
jgi:hypothetical protein